MFMNDFRRDGYQEKFQIKIHPATYMNITHVMSLFGHEATMWETSFVGGVWALKRHESHASYNTCSPMPSARRWLTHCRKCGA
jgi:hypothetical protein